MAESREIEAVDPFAGKGEDLEELRRLGERLRDAALLAPENRKRLEIPYHSESYVIIRKLTPAQARQYDGLLARGRIERPGAETAVVEYVPTFSETYMFLMLNCVEELRLKEGERETVIRSSDPEYKRKRFFAEQIAPELADWLEQVIKIFNTITPESKERKRGAS